MKAQTGSIKKIGRSWYGRWREDVLVEGQVKRQQRFVKLCDCDDRYRTKLDVRPLLADRLRALNGGRADARSSLTLASFVREYYEPYVRENFKPSTIHGYLKLWKDALCPRLGEIRLRDFRTVDAANVLTGYAAKGWGRRSLQHAKSLLSGIFTYAKNLGVLDGVNPIQGTMIPRKATPPAETHASTPEEVLATLALLEKAQGLEPRQRIQSQVAVGLMFFAGLRPGEARGARWDDYNGKTLCVKHSVWRTHTTTPKTVQAAKPVPVIEPLRGLLAQLRSIDGEPESGLILRGVSGGPLNLEMLAKRTIVPALCNPDNYASPRTDRIVWHGYYAFRRGIATLASSVSRDPMAAKGLLRHTSVNTTLTHYIKDVPEVTENAMTLVEELFAKAGATAGRVQ
jgi:integrase